MKRSARADALEILAAALRAAEPARAVRTHCRRRGSWLTVGGRRYDLRRYRRILILGAGKASLGLAAGILSVLGPYRRKLGPSAVVVPVGTRGRLAGVRVLRGGHPRLNAASARGGRQLLRLVGGARADDLVIGLVSGGASALSAVPAAGISVSELARLDRALQASGAPIAEVNTVRRAISAIAGGRLAEAAAGAGARLVLVVSDVQGDRLDVIGAGPWRAGASAARARRVLAARGLWRGCPASIRAHLSGTASLAARSSVFHWIVSGPDTLARGAAECAVDLGYRVRVLTAGKFRYGPLDEVVGRHVRVKTGRGTCILSVGEVTVALPRTHGRGGRNQHFALAWGVRLARSGAKKWCVLSAGSDGADGSTGNAGAVVSDFYFAPAQAVDRAGRALARFDSETWHRRSGTVIRTGPTGTNLQDLRILLVPRQ